MRTSMDQVARFKSLKRLHIVAQIREGAHARHRTRHRMLGAEVVSFVSRRAIINYGVAFIVLPIVALHC
jgi:hypothetical protein